MVTVSFITLRDRPDLKERAAEWFAGKWSVPKTAYLAAFDGYLSGETDYGWYLALSGERIVGGLGVIENDFHPRRDLTPNICAVYVEADFRRRGIAGRLLERATDDLRAQGVPTVYLLTDHVGFYERYGWEYLFDVLRDGETEPSRVYRRRLKPAGAAERRAR